MPVVDWLLGRPGDSALGHAMMWRNDVVALHAIADAIIALSFFTIALGIVWYMRHRPGLLREYRVVAWLFSGFIFAAGVSQLLDIVSIWYPVHGLEGIALAATAAMSAGAVVLIRPLLPGLAALPSAQQLAEVNERLRREAEAHEATLRELESARHALEDRVVERSNELSLVNARFKTALRGASVTVFTHDRDLRYTSISSSMFGRTVADIVGRLDDDLLPLPSSAKIVACKREVLAGGEPKDCEFSVADGASLRWYDAHIEPLCDATGAIVGLNCAAVDVTARKANEAHLRDLMRELTHRSKNLLAVVQGMARQTARHTGATETFLDMFGARLQALSASHDLLVQESWHGACLSELVRSLLGHYLDGECSQVSVEGPALLLKPEAAQSLGLAVHELAVNAARFGALSGPAGRVSIVWRRMGNTKDDAVEILWSENGGPAVVAPLHRGFGSLVIERNLALTLDADISLTFPPEGARCRVVMPAVNVASGW